MTGTVKYGVISTARIAVNKHIPAIQDSINGEVVAISSRDLALAKSEAARLGIPKYYGSYKELIADPDIDAVVNPLPNTMHHEWTIRAANAGKHVMCEKPIAMTVQEAHEMHDAAEANGVQLAESFTHRLTEQMRYVRDSVANGLIGEVTRRTAGSAPTCTRSTPTFVRTPNSAEAACGTVGHIPSAPSDSCSAPSRKSHMRCGEIILAGTSTRRSSGFSTSRGNVAGTVSSSMEQVMTNRFYVIGSRGMMTVTHMFEEDAPVITEVDGKTEEIQFSGPNRFVVLYEQFSDTILNGTPQEFGRDDSVANTAAIKALLKSAGTGSPVEISSLL